MMRRLWMRLQTLFQRHRFVKELDDEIQFHLDQEIAENVAAGMEPLEARRAALRTFGNGTQAKEHAWDAWGWVRLEEIVQDVRYALRQLRKTPGFAATAALTLALGIGANAAIFTLVNAVMLKNLPVTDPKTLVRIGDNNDCCVNTGARDDGNYALFSTETYEQLRKNVPEFEDLAAMQAGFGFRPVIARRDRTPESARSVMGEFVSGNYFRTFGLRPEAGRLFTDEDDVKGAPIVAVMSYEMWKRNYRGDFSVIGSTFWINTKAVTVAGITPEGFYGDRLASTPPDFYLPIESMATLANIPYVHDSNVNWLYMIGRVKPGVNVTTLQAKISGNVKQLLAQTKSFSDETSKKLLDRVHVTLTPGGAGIQDLREQYASNLKLLMGASGLVLLIACANIANLLLARGMRRKVEMSVRTALGAARGRIVRQLLTESVVLAGLGGIVGLAVAYAGTQMLLALVFPGAKGVPIDARPSLAVLGFAFGAFSADGNFIWCASGVDCSEDRIPRMRCTAACAEQRVGVPLLQRGLVVLQAALSLVLLVAAGLFSQSLGKLEGSDLKLDSRNRYIIHINPQAAGYTQPQLEALYRMLEQRFHALPDVKNVGISSYTPMEDNNWGTAVQVQGEAHADQASIVRVNADYFDSVGTRVVMGRGIGVQDTATAPTVAVVNETFVKGMFPKGWQPDSEGGSAIRDQTRAGIMRSSELFRIRLIRPRAGRTTKCISCRCCNAWRAISRRSRKILRYTPARSWWKRKHQ